MIVFQQNHVEQPDTMVRSTANFHCLFLDDAHTRSSLAGVQNPRSSTLDCLHILVGHGGYTTHSLHNVQHQPLCLQEAAHFSRHDKRHITRADMSTILYHHLYLEALVKTFEYPLRQLHASQYAFLLYQKSGFPHSILGNTTQCGVVAVTYILRKRQIYQAVFQFIYCIHNLFRFL